MEQGKLLLSPEEASERLGLRRTTMYALLASGEIKSIKIGKLRRVPITVLQEYIDRKLASQMLTTDAGA